MFIEGSAFTGATSVEIDTVAATSFHVLSDAEIVAFVPPGVPGTGAGLDQVTVRTPAGSATAREGFGVFGSSQTWGPQQVFTADTDPSWVASADLNGDGFPDLVTANFGGTVSILLGNGDGTFQSATNLASGLGSAFVALQDLNGDGRPDIVVANEGGDFTDGGAVDGGSVAVFLDDGDGGVSQPLTTWVQAAALYLAVADFNGDGRPDVATANGDGTVSLLLGAGDGTFAPPLSRPVLGNVLSIATLDFNGDGRPDLVVAGGAADGGNAAVTLLNLGDGGFGAVAGQPVGAYPDGLAVGDLNGDGVLDVVTSNCDDSTVTVLFGTGGGALGPPQTLDMGACPWGVSVIDVNGDGLPDLTVPADNGTSLSVSLGYGDGGFGPAATFVVGSEPGGVAVADFNRDGRADIATANYGQGIVAEGESSPGYSVSVLLGEPLLLLSEVLPLQGGVGSTVLFTGPLFVPPVGVAFNGAAASVTQLSPTEVEAVVPAGATSGPLAITAGNGTATPGTFEVFSSTTINSTDYEVQVMAGGPGAVAVALGDLSGDGNLDAVTADALDGSVAVMLGDTGDTFLAPALFPAGSGADAVAVGDVDGDGIPDLVTANGTAASVSLLHGNGDGSFGAPTSLSVGSGPVAVALGDFDNDGWLDIAAVNRQGDSVSVMLSRGGGTFAAAETVTGFGAPSGLALADIDGDGHLDLVVSDSLLGDGGGGVSLLYGYGDGGFTAPTVLAVDVDPEAVAVGNLGASSILDVVTANGTAGTLSVLVGDGAGGFAPEASFAAGGSGPVSVAVSDLSGDGLPDVITTTSGAAQLAVLVGYGDGGLATPVPIGVGGGPEGIAVGQFDIGSTYGGVMTTTDFADGGAQVWKVIFGLNETG